MDPLDTLPIWFHYGGEFLRRENNVYYLGGQVEVSCIDRDKVSLPEVMGHLNDHALLKKEHCCTGLFLEGSFLMAYVF